MCIHGIPGYCRLCELGLGNVLGKVPYINLETGEVAACRFRGKLIPLEKRYELGLGVVSKFYSCSKGFGAVPGYPSCAECAPRCSGYDPKLENDDV